MSPSRFILLPVREIENILSPATILATLKLHCELPEIARFFAHSEYFSAPLGEMIENFLADVGPIQRHGNRKYADKSGTMNNKDLFCRNACSTMKTFDDLAEEAKALAREVRVFIENENEVRNG